jgi:hypothetical protein
LKVKSIKKGSKISQIPVKGKIKKSKEKKTVSKVVQSKATVRFSKEMFKNKKAEFAELCESKAKNKILYAWDMINAFPAFSGIIRQKRELKKVILFECKKHNLSIKEHELWMNTFLK